ncbi:MAG: hypothetical protein KO173_01900, partial [Methanoregulaceae archaeon]|nr:hypothetical protein [Methanoregulaceae archaeon]
TNRDAFHYLRHTQGQRNAIPATLRVLGLRPLCGEPQNGDRTVSGEWRSKPTVYRSTLPT